MQGPIIDIERVSFAYDGQPVLEDISLRVDPGDFLAVLGPNGGGKTTLLRLVLGLLAPSAGSIRVFGREPRLAAGRIGYVPQVVDVRPDFPMTVLDATLMGLMTPGGRGRRPGPAERDAAREALERVGLAGRENARIGELSGGQKQRAYIARALVSGPELLLLDEPTSSIDPQGKFCFFDLLSELGRGVTIVVVSHDVSVVSARVSCVACVNRRLTYSRGPELTPEMLTLLFGVHRHSCAMDAYMRSLAGTFPPLPRMP